MSLNPKDFVMNQDEIDSLLGFDPDDTTHVQFQPKDSCHATLLKMVRVSDNEAVFWNHLRIAFSSPWFADYYDNQPLVADAFRHFVATMKLCRCPSPTEDEKET